MQMVATMLIVTGIVDRIAAVRTFGNVHGDISTAQQRTGIVSMFRKCSNADAAIDIHGLAGNRDVFLQCALDALNYSVYAMRVAVGDQYCKLITAQPGNGV